MLAASALTAARQRAADFASRKTAAPSNDKATDAAPAAAAPEAEAATAAQPAAEDSLLISTVLGP
jgi:hypothetical protein